MKEEPDRIKKQAAALRRIQAELGLASMREFAQELHVHGSRLSRWMNQAHPEQMSPKGRLLLAELLGRRFDDMKAVSEFLDRVHWSFDEAEWHVLQENLERRRSDWQTPPVQMPFVGREAELEMLQSQLLAEGKSAPRLLVVQGVGGVGKTTLVNRLLSSRKVQQRFDRMFYVSFDLLGLDQSNLTSRIEAVEQYAYDALVEQVVGAASLSVSERFRGKQGRMRLRQKLEGQRALLVLDGVDEPMNLADWDLVDVEKGRVLVTTRRRDLAKEAWTWSLGGLDRVSSRAMLTSGIQVDVEEEEINWLVDLLGGLPLGLELVNRMARWLLGLRELIQELRKEPLEALDVGQKPQDSVRQAFALSYCRLDEAAQMVFRILSLFPQPFEVKATAAVSGWTQVQVGRVMRTLVRLGLIWPTQAGRYVTHHLLHIYAGNLCAQQDRDVVCVWKARLAEYYQDEANWQAWTQAEGWSYDDSTAEWRVHIERGCTYAYELGRGDLVLAYLQHISWSAAFCDDAALGERWWGWAQELVEDERELAIGALAMAEFYRFSETVKDQVMPEINKALSLARRARLAFGGDRAAAAMVREWTRSAMVEIRASLILEREQGLALLNGEWFWQAVISLPEGDPLLYEACQICMTMYRRLGKDRVPELVERAQRALARWRAGVTDDYAGRVQRLEAQIIEGGQMMQDADPAEALRFFEQQAVEMAETGCGRERLINAIYRALVLAELGDEEAAKAVWHSVGLSAQPRAKVWRRRATSRAKLPKAT